MSDFPTDGPIRGMWGPAGASVGASDTIRDATVPLDRVPEARDRIEALEERLRRDALCRTIGRR